MEEEASALPETDGRIAGASVGAERLADMSTGPMGRGFLFSDNGTRDGFGHPALVRYWWTCDGEAERCFAECAVAPAGASCYHCGAPFTDNDAEVIKLTSEADGEKYLLHPHCAIEGVDAPDAAVISSLLS